MPDNVFLNRDRSAVVDEWHADKKFQVPRSEAVKLGLLDSAEKPIQQRRVSESPLQRPAPEKVGPTAQKRRKKA